MKAIRRELIINCANFALLSIIADEKTIRKGKTGKFMNVHNFSVYIIGENWRLFSAYIRRFNIYFAFRAVVYVFCGDTRISVFASARQVVALKAGIQCYFCSFVVYTRNFTVYFSYNNYNSNNYNRVVADAFTYRLTVTINFRFSFSKGGNELWQHQTRLS